MDSEENSVILDVRTQDEYDEKHNPGAVLIPNAEIEDRAVENAFDMAGCRAEDTVMVGDRLDNDILPAKAVGMKTIWIRKGLSVYQTSDAADCMIDNLCGLKNYLSGEHTT